MALTVKDRVRVVTTTTGTSDFTLGAAVAGYQSFSVIGDGNTTYYTCSDSVTGDWEVGVGTYSSSGPTLSRDTVLESSNSGSKVSFAAGSKDLFVTYPAERAVYLDTAGSAVTTLDVGTLGVSTANITTANITSGTVSNTPSSGTDIANKTYVDTIASSGVTYHAPVKYEAPNALTATYNNGTSGVGATLTNSGTLGAFTPDGVVASVNDRILVYQQASAAHNGVYTVTTVGDGSTAWVLTRSTDTDSYALKDPNGLGEGDAFFVTSGNTGAGETYICNTQGTITFGTTAINFVQVSSAQIYSAGTGLTLSGTQFSITNTGTAGTYGSASSVPVLTTNAQGQVTGVTDTAISITSAAVSGLAASATTDTTNAANITSGTLPSARLIGSYANITGVGTLTSGTWNASTIGATYGGTGQSSYTTGDLLYASSSSALSTLADVATGNALISGGVGTAPSWGKVGLTTHVSGTLPVASGGTGATTLTGYVYGNGTGAMTASTSIPNAATTATSANTASAIVARDASGNFSAGTITASLSGNATSATSATSATTATNLAGGVAGAVPYQSGSGATAFSAAGTSGQVLTSAGTSAPTWTTPATVNNGTLTMAVSGTGLSGSASFTANQSGASSFTVTSNATNANTASTIVARDASGNFSAGTITATGFSGPLNGTVGATTPSTGAFTTLSATGAISGTGADNNIVLSQNGSTQWRINNSNAGTAAAANLLLQNGTAVAGVYLFGTGYTTNGVLKANSASLYNNNSAGVSIAADNASGVITFASGGLTERARITSSGVFYLGPQATNFSFTNGSAVDLSGSGTGLAGNGTNLTLGVWNGPIVFQAGNSGGALVERARIDSSGNVGIGTSSPSSKLQVANGALTISDATTHAFLKISPNSGSAAFLDIPTVGSSLLIRTSASSTTDTNAVAVTSSGNVGIGGSPSTATRTTVQNCGSPVGYWVSSGVMQLQANAVYNSGDKFVGTGYALYYAQDPSAGAHVWSTSSASGTAGNAVTYTERMRIDSSGNVGIGTSSPTSYGDANTKLAVVSNTSGTADVNIRWGTNAVKGILYCNDLSGAGIGIGSTTSAYLGFLTNGTERMRINSSGNVGIGVTPSSGWRSVDRVLQIQSSGVIRGQTNANLIDLGSNYYINNSNLSVYIASDYASRFNQYQGVFSWESAASGTAGNTITWTERMRIDSSGNVGIGLSTVNDKLSIVDGNYLSFQTASQTFNSGRVARIGGISVGSGNGYMTFETYQGGSGGGERMRIDSSGNVGIGTSSPTTKLQVNGTVTATAFAGALTAAQVGDAYAGLGAGSVGSLVLGKYTVGSSTLTYGQTTSGSNIVVSNAAGGVAGLSGVTLSGTWRCLGTVRGAEKNDAASTTLWIRIS